MRKITVEGPFEPEETYQMRHLQPTIEHVYTQPAPQPSRRRGRFPWRPLFDHALLFTAVFLLSVGIASLVALWILTGAGIIKWDWL